MALNTINLNFINMSNDKNNSSVVIFQKNVTANFDELSVAWKVIKNCGYGDNHPFEYTYNMDVNAEDSWGNFTPKLSATNGELYQVIKDDSGTKLETGTGSTSVSEVQVLNGLQAGAIKANVYRSGKLLATKTTIAPQQKAVFEFKPIIYIGAASQVQEGEVLNSAILSAENKEISLLGISQADIIMTGGGPGQESGKIQFTLSNQVMA